jgi:hypothetical protein
MKKKIVVLIVFIFAFVFAATALSVEFWGSKNSNKYHYPSCKWAQKINPANLIKFNTPEEAKKAGYIPCKVCRPPASSKAQSGNVTLASLNNGKEEYRRGCCSWHGGVCGCQGGRVLCCDGTLSPTCRCGK